MKHNDYTPQKVDPYGTMIGLFFQLMDMEPDEIIRSVLQKEKPDVTCGL